MKKGEALEQTSQNVQEAEVNSIVKDLGEGFKIYTIKGEFRIVFLNEIASVGFESEEDAEAYFQSKPYSLILTAAMIVQSRVEASRKLEEIEKQIAEINETK